MKILVCAYACLRDPDTRFGGGKGGESVLGWNMVLQMSKFAEVFVLVDSGNREAIEKKLEGGNLPNIHFCYVSLPTLFSFTKKVIQIESYVWQIKAYFVAKKLHTKNNFDAFHHLTYANDWMASFIGALLPVPYIRGPGGGAHQIPRAFLENYSPKEKFQEFFRGFAQWMFRHDPFFVMGQNRAKKILVCNDEAFDALKTDWQKKAELFPVNGVSAADFPDVQRPESGRWTSGKRFAVVTAGKLIKLKNVDLGIEAFAVFAKKNSNARLVVVGDGPERENLRNLAKEKNIAEKVMFKAWMSRNDLLAEIGAADVFLFPSLRDGGGAVVVEAMAQGKPVVCFDLAGPGFHVRKEFGVKIAAENPKQAVTDIAAALESLYRNPQKREQMGTAAKKQTEEYYLWDELGERMKKIYQSIL